METRFRGGLLVFWDLSIHDAGWKGHINFPTPTRVLILSTASILQLAGFAKYRGVKTKDYQRPHTLSRPFTRLFCRSEFSCEGSSYIPMITE